MTNDQVNLVVAEAHTFFLTQPEIFMTCQIGSSVYLPDPKDVDFIVCLKMPVDPEVYLKSLMSFGWESCSSYEAFTDGWVAIRKGDLNLIITADGKSYDAYRKAMLVCHALNLTDKKDRRMVCRIIRDNMTLEEVKVKWEKELWKESFPATKDPL